MVADLHIHTTASDGTFTPQEVVRKAKKLGFRAISITDHDTIEGILPAQEEGEKVGLEVIPGVELNTDFDGAEVHILGYFFDMEDISFQNVLNKLKDARSTRVIGIVEQLNKLGIEVSLDRVMELAGKGSIGRPHIARAMLEKGYVKSIREAFDKYIGFGGPAYVNRYKINSIDAIQLIKDAKGLPVLAHPGILNEDHLIEVFAKSGLMGIEVFHSEHNLAKVNHYRKLAEKLGLLMTGGSDCHGPNYKNEALIGKIRVPYINVIQLKEAKQKINNQKRERY